jgi:3-methyl-2-oxobutanoate hydroxymethyltransferase
MKIHEFKRKKQEQHKIAVVTCYDFPSACTVAESEVHCVLVGDSVAMAVHGHNNTIMATVEMMVLHTEAVARGIKKQFLITDLPFLSHKISLEHAMMDVKRIMQAGAHAIKIEGADEDTCNTIAHIVHSGVPVMGHIGLTPQSIHQLGGYKVQGKDEEQAHELVQQAQKLEQAGCFALVIECVPHQLAKTITNSIHIPTIGIGAGIDTDGQVLVWHDLLGLQDSFNPKFVKRFVKGKELLLHALNSYAKQVEQCQFPTDEYMF